MRQHINNRRIVTLDLAFAISILPERDGNNPVLVALFPLNACISESFLPGHLLSTV